MSHVETVTVHRCGMWGMPKDEGGGCGNERFCRPCEAIWRDSHEFRVAITEVLRIDATDDEAERLCRLDAWPRGVPKPTEQITHAEFVRLFDRCPDGCVVAEQIVLEAIA